MSRPTDASNQEPARVGEFEPTRWSLVLAAGRGSGSEAQAALETLCRAYWYPLYACVRRKGHTAEDAQDLTQEYFARLLRKEWLLAVDPGKGRFRSFLLASLKHFLANEWDRARSQKRGGGQRILSIDASSAESRYAMEPSDDASPDRLFDRRWALTLLDQVMALLREEYTSTDRTAIFDELKATLAGDKTPYAVIAARLGLTEGAVKSTARRLKERYRAILRGEILQTVASPADVDDELRHLFSILST